MTHLKKLFLLGLLLPTISFAQAKPQDLDHIVAVVNDDVITASELNKRVMLIKEQSRANNMQIPSDAALRKQVLQQLIDVDLELQLAKANNLQVDNNQLNQAVRDIAKRNGLSVTQMKQKVEAQGQSYANYRKEIRKEILISQIQQQAVGKDIIVSDDQVDTFLKEFNNDPNRKEYHVKNILIPLPESASAEQIKMAKTKANNIIKQLKQGSNFSEIAMAESSSQTALQGGDLGWRKKAELPSAFAKYVVNMKPGDIEGPIQASNGIHIIKLVDSKSSESQLDRTQAQQLLFKRKFEEGLQNWLQELRVENTIIFMD